MRIVFGIVPILLLGAVAAGFARAETVSNPPPPRQLQLAAGYGTIERRAERAGPEDTAEPQSDMSVEQAVKIVDQSREDDAAGTQTVPMTYTPPPRRIDDITAILDKEKPDPAKRTAQLAIADKPPPAGAAPADLAEFYFQRGVAARDVGRGAQYLDDEKKARDAADQANLEPAKKDRYLAQLSVALQDTGDVKAALDLQDVRLAAPVPNNFHLRIFYLKFNYALLLGRLDVARDALAHVRNPNLPGGRALQLRMLGKMAFAEGRYAEAETTLRASLAIVETLLQSHDDQVDTWRRTRDFLHSDLSLDLLSQRRMLEAEAEARIALLGQLQAYGHYAPETAVAMQNMCVILLAEGRYAEAERLATAGRDILTTLGQGAGSMSLANALTRIATAQSWQGKQANARATYAELFRVVGTNPDLRDRYIDQNLNYAGVMLLQTHSPDAIRAFQYIVDRNVARLGERDYATALARGWLGVAYREAGDNAHAAEAFAAAMPVLLSNARTSEAQNDDSQSQPDRGTEVIGEAYLSLLAESGGAAAATFVLGDALRGRSVGQALAASSARASTSDPALAVLARHEQDAAKQIGALQGMLTNLLSQPSAEQEPGGAAKLQERIAQLRAARGALRREIARRFPLYADYTDPKPATLEQAQKSLRQGEAMIAFFLGSDHLFVWAVPQNGPPAFAATKIAYKDIAGMVGNLRRSVDPNAATLDQIPEFDVAQAYRLYQLLLKPVETGWSGARTLIVVPHRVLGELPLSLLVTMPTNPVSKGPLPFASYKSVPFLVRQLGVAQLPSVGALATLRGLPAAAGAHSSFAGFGDPWFNPEQARDAANDKGAGIKTTQLQSRGIPIRRRAAPRDDGEIALAQLPRLPDTAEEVRSIATTLHADPAKDVFLGAAANEQTVRTLNLADRRIIVFATHGLVPGDLAGLTQPALALSAPSVAKVGGDGLLTVDKILALKLNADWVVLSACNTAAAGGAGVEAVSGLGRAFFYAGARALLVSNWPVETISARTLTSDLFRRAVENAKLPRAEALRQAELALIDGPGAVDPASGKPIFSYAHPIFWAPFAVVGDGGAPIE